MWYFPKKCARIRNGRVAEWLKAHDSKSCDGVDPFGGSNPLSSAKAPVGLFFSDSDLAVRILSLPPNYKAGPVGSYFCNLIEGMRTVGSTGVGDEQKSKSYLEFFEATPAGRLAKRAYPLSSAKALVDARQSHATMIQFDKRGADGGKTN